MNQYSSLSSGSKKGVVLSLDTSIAVIIVSIIIIISTTYITKSNNDYTSRMQLVKTGADIMTILDYNEVLNTMDSNKIASRMNQTLPVGYYMKVRIETNDSRIIETPGLIPDDRFIGTGRKLFAITNKTNTVYAIARFWIWNL